MNHEFDEALSKADDALMYAAMALENRERDSLEELIAEARRLIRIAIDINDAG